MESKYKKFLPIGSVILLRNAKKRIMITGFLVKDKTSSEKKYYDYIGCLYPEGVFDTEKNLIFNHSDIERIYAIGYSDEEEKQFKQKLEAEIKEG